MASTSVSRIVPATPDQVWQLVGGFHALPDWLPYIPRSTSLEAGAPAGCTTPTER